MADGDTAGTGDRSTGISGALREHWPFLVLVVVGIAFRVLAHLAHRPALFFNDSFAYLANTAELDTDLIWPIGYSVFLRPLLAFGDLAVIPLVQHLMGLALATLVYVLVRRWGGPRWLATLAVVPLLLDGYQVQSEHRILAETLFTALVVAGLAVATWNRRPGVVATLAGGILLGLSVPVRHVGIVLIAALVVGVVLAAGTWRRSLALSLVAVVGFGLPVGGYLALHHQETDRWGLGPEWLTPRMLYARVARFVDCPSLDVPATQQPLCPTPDEQATILTDHFNWRPFSPLNQWDPAPGVDRDAETAAFARRALREQPGEAAWFIGLDVAKAFAPDKRTYAFDQSVERWRFQVTEDRFVDRAREAVATYGGTPPVIVQPWASWLRRWQVSYGTVPPILLGVAGLIGLAGAALALRRGRSDLGGRAAAWALAGFGLVVLPAAYQFSWRYQVPTFALFPVAGAAGWQAWSAVRRRPGGGDDDVPDGERGLEQVDRAALAAVVDEDRPRTPLVVVIAAWMEQDGVADVVAGVPAEVAGLATTVVVVDDGSTDDTAARAAAAGAMVVRPGVNRGQGAALRLGYAAARRRDARYVATLDADGQYDPADLEVVVAPLVADEADFVTGSRRLGSEETTDGFRRAGVRVFAWLATVLSGQRITDTSNGLRAMRAEVTREVLLLQPQYQASELLMATLAHGYRVVERPTTMRDRTAGGSKKGNDLLYGFRYARVLVGTWWRERS